MNRFLWVALVLEIILNVCQTPGRVMDTIKELPIDLEKLYLSCLRRTKDSIPVCDFASLMVACAAPVPMENDALRQLLALNTTTGDFAAGSVPTIDSIMQSGVGLLTFDRNEQLVLPVHDSVRAFIFSDSASVAIEQLANYGSVPGNKSLYQGIATAVRESPSDQRESTARSHIGKACLLHIRRRASVSLANPPSHVRQAIPTTTIRMPTVLRHVVSRLMPRSSRIKTVNTSLQPRLHHTPEPRSGFLQYAIQNWIACNEGIREDTASEQWELFALFSLQRNQSWNIHPWPALTQSDSQHLAGMFAYSVANGHVPLLKLALSKEGSLPLSIFTGLLPNHGHLPALHVACKMGHAEIVPLLLRVCKPLTTCSADLSRTALHYAAEAGHVGCVKALSADESWNENFLTKQDASSKTALALAILNGHEEMASYLVRQCFALSGPGHLLRYMIDSLPATLELCQKHGWCYDMLMDNVNSSDLNQLRGHNGTTLLIMAAMFGRTARVQELCAIVDVHAQDMAGRTVLWHASHRGLDSVVEILLRSTSFVKSNEPTQGDTALHAAARGGHTAIVRKLLDTALVVNMWKYDKFDWGYGKDGLLPIEHAVLNWRNSGRSEEAKATVDVFLVRAMTTYVGRCFELHSFITAATEIGQVTGAKSLATLWNRRSMAREIPEAAVHKGAVKHYFSNRALGLEGFKLLRIDEDGPFPLPLFWAATWQHTDPTGWQELVALLLQTRNDDERVESLMMRGREFKKSALHAAFVT